MKRMYIVVAALFAACGVASAAVPGLISYQGTLRKDGRLFSGTVPMEFYITDVSGASRYWDSGSTDIVVSTGLFRYQLGASNGAQFAAIDWKDITPYVVMTVSGVPLPPDPLYSSVYALHSLTAESSTGTFTVNGGDLRLSGPGQLVFSDGTAQRSAAGWSVSANGYYVSFSGRAGIGVPIPAAALDIKPDTSSSAGYSQFWRDASGAVLVASMSASGELFADASGLRNLPSGNVVDTLSATLGAGNDAGGQSIVNAGAVGASSLAFAPEVLISSASQAEYGGILVSTNVYLPAGAKYYGNGSGLTGLDASAVASGSLPEARLSQNVPLLSSPATFISSLTVTDVRGVSAAALTLSQGVRVSSAAPNYYGGVLVSTNIYLPPGAKYYGDGSGLTGIGAASGNIVDPLDATLNAGANAGGYGMVNLGSVAIGAGTAVGRLDVQASAPGTYMQIWRDSAGVAVASMTDTGAFYADASHMRGLPSADNLGNHTATQALNMSGFDVKDAGAVTASGPVTVYSSVTVAGASVFSSTAAFTAQALSVPGVYISSGLVVASGSVGIGTSSPQETLDVNGGVRIGNSNKTAAGTIRYTGAAFQGYSGGGWVTLNGTFNLESSDSLWGVTSNTVYTVGASSMVAIGTMDAGVSKLRVTGADNTAASNALLAENQAFSPLLVVRDDGNIGMGVAAPAARLDVQSAGGYTQIWRASDGTVVSSMSAAGVLYADASALRGLPSGDNLGNHTLTRNLDTNGYWISGDGSSGGLSVNSGNVGIGINPPTARLEISGGTGSGVKFDTFHCTGTDKLTVDLSGNLVCSSDQTGANVVDTLSATLAAGDDAGGFGIVNVGSITASGGIFTSSGVTVTGGSGVASPRFVVAADVVISSSTPQYYGGLYISSNVYLPAGAKYYGDGSALSGVSGSDNFGDHVATKDIDMAGFSVLNISSLTAAPGVPALRISTGMIVAGGIGASGPVSAGGGVSAGGLLASTISASGYLALANLTAQPSGAGAGALYYNSAAFSGQGGLYVNLNGFFLPIATGTVAGGGGMTGVVSNANEFAGDGAGGGALTLKASSVTLQGNVFNGAGQLVQLDGSGRLPALDGSALHGVGGGDDFGDHIATKDINMAGFNILNVSALSAAAGAQGVQISTSLVVSGALGVTGAAAGASLDVMPSLAGYAQFWRDAGGVVVATMTSSGVLYADGSQLRNLPSGGGGTLSSVLTAGGDAGGQNMVNIGDITETGHLTAYSSMTVSGGLGVAGGIGASGPVSAGGGVSAGGLLASTISASGYLALANLTAQPSGAGAGALYYNSAAFSGQGGLYVNLNGFFLPIATGTVAGGGGGGGGSLSATLSAGSDAGGFGMTNLGNVAIGVASAGARLDVAGSGGYIQVWRDSSGVIVASMTNTGAFYASNIAGGGGGGGVLSCTNPNDPNDILVQVGDFCVDKYEASVWSAPTGGTEYGTASANYPCSSDGHDCGPGTGKTIYARSVSGVTPSAYITWLQADLACANEGKHLITNAEWQAAAAGTPAGSCNTSGTGPTTTGAGGACVSAFGAENMIGSLWELVSDWGLYTPNTGAGAWGDGEMAAGSVQAPLAMTARGGSYNTTPISSATSGPLSFFMGQIPTFSDATLGFRCGMQLR